MSYSGAYREVMPCNNGLTNYLQLLPRAAAFSLGQHTFSLSNHMLILWLIKDNLLDKVPRRGRRLTIQFYSQWNFIAEGV